MSSVVPVPLAEEMGDARTRPGMNPCGPGRLLLFSEPYHPQLEESKPLPHILLLKALGLGLEGVSYHLRQSTAF